MRNALKFAMGVALAGTLVNMLVKRRAGNTSPGATREDSMPGEDLPQSPPVESIRDSAGTPASAIPAVSAPQNPQGF